jgi:hypothetical protein
MANIEKIKTMFSRSSVFDWCLRETKDKFFDENNIVK